MSHWSIDTTSPKYKSFELLGARPHYTPDRPGQVEHIFLDLTLDISHQACHGTCQIRLNPVRGGITELTLDAEQLDIEGVRVGRTKQPFTYDGHQLSIQLKQPTTLGKSILLSIGYRIDHPQRGLYFVQPTQDYPDKPSQVWTQGEDEDSRFWFPCFDYPGQLATSELRVRVPASYTAISNGALIEHTQVGKDAIFHWRQDEVHPTYLMTLAVGEFVALEDQWQHPDGSIIPVHYYVTAGREADAQRTMGKTPRMIAFYSEKYGYPYPYPKYAQVCVDDFIFGGMENTSTTLLTDRCLTDERAQLDYRAGETLVAHELVHQWFGDLVVIKHWSHAWIKEGMASYGEVLWMEYEYGVEEAAYYRLQEARRYFSEDEQRYRRPVVTHIYREAIELYDRHIYEKGSCIYHMMRAELGEELFWRAIQTFVQGNAHRTVESIDLLRAIEKSTGRNLAFLFDQYVYRGGYPVYKIGYSWDAASHLAKITIAQTQVEAKESDSIFDWKFPISFYGVENTKVKTIQTIIVRVHEAEQTFYIPLPEKPTFFLFDPTQDILKKVILEVPLPELKAQLQYASDPVARIFAAEAIAKQGTLEAVYALAQSLQDESFWGVRDEVAKFLATIKLDQTFEALLVGLSDDNAHVRCATVEAISSFNNSDSYRVIRPLAEQGDPSYYVEAAALTALGKIAAATLQGKPKEEKILKIFKAVLKGRAGWNEVVRSGAIAGLSQLTTSTPALSMILEYTVSGTPQPLRLAAIRALGVIYKGQAAPQLEAILDRLSVLADESFFLIQVSVVAALGQMETPKAISILQKISDRTMDGRVRRMADEAIRTVGEAIGTNHAVQNLQKELDELRKSNQDLKSRVAELEAKMKEKD
jgi:aminopeptidase N